MEETTEVEYQISADKGISNTWMTSELHTYMWVGKTLRNLVEKRLGCLKKKKGQTFPFLPSKRAEFRIWAPQKSLVNILGFLITDTIKNWKLTLTLLPTRIKIHFRRRCHNWKISKMLGFILKNSGLPREHSS